EAFAAIRSVAERHSAEVERVVRGWFDRRDDMEPVSREELAGRMREGLVTVIDVRPADEFALSHLPGAVNVSLSELESRLPALQADREIVAYYRGPWSSCPLRSSPNCAGAASTRADWRTDTPSGRPPVCR